MRQLRSLPMLVMATQAAQPRPAVTHPPTGLQSLAPPPPPSRQARARCATSSIEGASRSQPAVAGALCSASRCAGLVTASCKRGLLGAPLGGAVCSRCARCSVTCKAVVRRCWPQSLPWGRPRPPACRAPPCSLVGGVGAYQMNPLACRSRCTQHPASPSTHRRRRRRRPARLRRRAPRPPLDGQLRGVPPAPAL